MFRILQETLHFKDFPDLDWTILAWFLSICCCSGWTSGVEIPTLPCTWLHPTSHQPWPASLLLQKGGKLTAWCGHLHIPQRDWCVPVDLECQFKAGGFLAQPNPTFNFSTAPPQACLPYSLVFVPFVHKFPLMNIWDLCGTAVCILSLGGAQVNSKY